MDPRQEVKSSPEDDIMEQKQSTVSLKKSPPSARAFSVGFSLEKRELAQPRGFGWLKPLEDVTMCKASFTHTHTYLSAVQSELSHGQSLEFIFHMANNMEKSSAAPKNGKISRKGQSQVEHYKFHSVLQPICETACLFLSSNH